MSKIVSDVWPASVTVYEGDFALDADVVAWVWCAFAFVAGAF